MVHCVVFSECCSFVKNLSFLLYIASDTEQSKNVMHSLATSFIAFDMSKYCKNKVVCTEHKTFWCNCHCQGGVCDWSCPFFNQQQYRCRCQW